MVTMLTMERGFTMFNTELRENLKFFCSSKIKIKNSVVAYIIGLSPSFLYFTFYVNI